ncbi:dTDP-4-dehydrorhamnose reductase [Povalibacter sp.]|uniref:dTDP-4-dehydrorhamnose reductase n=1 Tax=Povalibacter sp. TaxID=1962978 RepID=UPI002F406007
MRVLITGAGGQVGRALSRLAPPDVTVLPCTRTELDLADERTVRSKVVALRPDLLINAAAYTAVDKAESDAEAARLINTDSVRWLAEEIAAQPASRMLHISTDFVFDGKTSTPYAPGATTAPLSVYGQTKLNGEQAVSDVLGSRGLVLRTSWVYDASGRNFVNTMLRLMREGRPLRVVADQVGTPTAADSIATVLWQLVRRTDLSGVWHWTDAGVASWYDFAVAIGEEAELLGLVRSHVDVAPIATPDYPTAARRPAFSVLDRRATVEALDIVPAHWRQQLRRVMKEIAFG